MTKSTKIWLWFALALSVATTLMNASYGRWISVVIAVAALAGLCVLLFTQKRWGYLLMCGCYVLAFAWGAYESVAGGTGLLSSLIMSLIGSALIPLVTWLFLRKQWQSLK